MTKLSAIPPATTPATTDSLVAVQSPGSSPQDVLYPISSIANTNVLTSPSKFNVYLASAENVGTSPTAVGFDTANFDTGSNVDLVTNKGRFTCTIAGYYQFNTNILTTAAGSGTNIALYLYKNGTVIATLGFIVSAASNNPGDSGGTLLKLAVNDFIDVRVGTAAAAKALDIGSVGNNTFSGFLYATH